VEVFEDEDERADLRATQRHGSDGIEDSGPARGRVDGGNSRIAGVHRQEVADERYVGFEPAHPPHAVLDLGDDLRLAVELLDPEVAPELIDDGQERDRLAERDALALEPGDVLVRLREPAAKLQEQPRLADPRLARHEDHLTPPRPNLAQALAQGGKLAPAPHQGREPPLDGGVQPRATPPRPQHLVGAHRRVALHRLLA
jgi:hypothetical protein